MGKLDGRAALRAEDVSGGVLEPRPTSEAQGVRAVERDRLLQDLEAHGAGQVFALWKGPIA